MTFIHKALWRPSNDTHVVKCLKSLAEIGLFGIIKIMCFYFK